MAKCRWEADREEMQKTLDSYFIGTRAWRELDAQIKALDALYTLLESGAISQEYYKTSLWELALIDTGNVAFYTGLT